MKKLFILMTLAFLVSCGNKNEESIVENEIEEKSRIQYIESKSIRTHGIYLIKVDSIEYVYTTEGGIVRHNKSLK